MIVAVYTPADVSLKLVIDGFFTVPSTAALLDPVADEISVVLILEARPVALSALAVLSVTVTVAVLAPSAEILVGETVVVDCRVFTSIPVTFTFMLLALEALPFLSQAVARNVLRGGTH